MIPGIVAAQRVVPPVASQFPEVLSAQSTPSAGAVVSLPVTYSAEAGDLVILNFSSRHSTATEPTLSSSGWTLLGGAGVLYGTSIVDFLWYKVASETESGVTITPPESINCVANVLVIRAGTHQGVVEGESLGAGGQPDPPSLTPSWGYAKTLWLSTFARGSGVTVSTYPLPDNNVSSRSSATTGGDAGGVCSNILETATMNPGSWVVTQSGGNVSRTLAVRPAM